MINVIVKWYYNIELNLRYSFSFGAQCRIQLLEVMESTLILRKEIASLSFYHVWEQHHNLRYDYYSQILLVGLEREHNSIKNNE